MNLRDRRFRVALCAGIALSVASAPTMAQPSASEKAAAEALFDEAQALMKANDYAAACTKFEQSQRVDPAIGTLLYLADCYEKQGRLASAWATFREGASAAQVAGQTDRARAGERRAQLLEGRLSHLTLDVAPELRAVEGVTVERGAVAVQKALWGIAVPVDAGQYEVVVKAPGHKTWRGSVNVEAGAANATLAIPMLERETTEAAAVPPPAVPPAAAPTPAPVPAPRDPGAEPSANDGSGQRTLAIVVAAAGVVGVGLGSAWGLSAINDNDEAKTLCPRGDVCDDPRGVELTDEAKSAATRSNIAFALGGAALIGGALLYFTAPSAKQETAWRVAPALSPRGGGVSVGGRF